MKRLFFMFLLLGMGWASQAQEETYTDEELKTYASVMIWAESETENLKSLVKDSVEIWIGETVLSASKYNELSKAKGDYASLEASQEEIAVFNEIQNRIEAKKTAFTENYKSKIMDEIGGSLYNRLKKSLKSDEAVKSRYETIVSKLKSEESSSGITE